MSPLKNSIADAITALKKGLIIAYPTEAVYGLGCDPFNPKAVKKLYTLKERPEGKGIILVAANWDQLKTLIAKDTPTEAIARAQATWPGPYTWIFPAAEHLPIDLCGPQKTIALRISPHPVVRALCYSFGAPIVSTSANKSGQEPARAPSDLSPTLCKQIEVILPGRVDTKSKPTQIADALTNTLVRAH